MEQIGERDQWLLDGDCTRCRRAKHCSKPCKRAKNFQMRKVYGIAMRAAVGIVSDLERKRSEVRQKEE